MGEVLIVDYFITFNSKISLFANCNVTNCVVTTGFAAHNSIKN